jgi:transposase
MKAIHGDKAKNDKIDALKIATLLRGGTLPQSYVDPPEMRATRDLLRRRLHLVRRRANLLAHIQNTHHQYNLDFPTAKIARVWNLSMEKKSETKGERSAQKQRCPRRQASRDVIACRQPGA